MVIGVEVDAGAVISTASGLDDDNNDVDEGSNVGKSTIEEVKVLLEAAALAVVVIAVENPDVAATTLLVICRIAEEVKTDGMLIEDAGKLVGLDELKLDTGSCEVSGVAADDAMVCG